MSQFVDGTLELMRTFADMLASVNKNGNINVQRKANWIGHILRRNCLLKQVIAKGRDGSNKKTRKKT